MATAKESIETPTAQRKLDRKDIDQILHFLKYGYECESLGFYKMNNSTDLKQVTWQWN